MKVGGSTTYQNQYYYNFWVSYCRTEEDPEWRALPARKEIWLKAEGNSVNERIAFFRAIPLFNNEVILLSLQGDPDQLPEFFPIKVREVGCIRRAAEVGLVPVLHLGNDRSGVMEHIESYRRIVPECPERYEDWELPIPFYKKTDRIARQCGPAHLEGVSALLDGDAYIYPYDPYLVGEDGMPVLPEAGAARKYRLREGVEPLSVFEDGQGYVFPKYVHLTDLEKTLPDRLYDQIVRYRPNYRDCRNDIMSIAIDLTQNLLTVFSGDPGCGKTSICNIFAQVLGLRGTERYVTVPVERGWTSKRDFIGYYNPLQGGLVLANEALHEGLENVDEEDAPLLVLLDEANLSSMEYYWSDFMQIAGSDENEADRTINLGGGHTVPVSEKCRFAATINNDHTTEELSPRIIDRAAIVSLPTRPYEEGEPLPRRDPENREAPVSWSSLQAVFGGSTAEMTGGTLAVYGELRRMLAELRVVVSNRAEKAVRRFWSAARQEGVFAGETQEERDTAALDYAAAQRLLPKLAGSGAEFRGKLETLQQYCEGSGLTKCAEILNGIIQRGGEAGSALSYYSFF